MKKVILLIPIFLIAVFCNSAQALDWKGLHELSETISLDEALLAVGQRPDSLSDLYVLGLVYLDQYMVSDARQAFEKMKRIDPASFEAQWGIAETLKRAHDFEKSEPVLREIIKQNPEYAPAYVSLAYIKYLQHKFKESIRMSGEVINMDPQAIDLESLVQAHGLYSAARGMLSFYSGPLSKAINFAAVKRHLKIAKALKPESPVVYYGYANFYMLIPSLLGRDLDKAQDFLEKAVAADPLFPDTYVRLAQIYLYRGDKAKYSEYLDKALGLDPQNELALDVKSGRCEFICLTQGK